jgi:hypothetical protein
MGYILPQIRTWMNGLAGRRGFFSVAAYTMAYRSAPALDAGEVKRQAGIKLKILATTFRDPKVPPGEYLYNSQEEGLREGCHPQRHRRAERLRTDPAALKERTDRPGNCLNEQIMRFTHLSDGLFTPGMPTVPAFRRRPDVVSVRTEGDV